MRYPEVCPHCGSKIIKPVGPSTSKVALVKTDPSTEEIRMGYAWAGKAEEIVKTELALRALDINQMRCVNMWLHEPNDNEDCKNFSYEYAIKELLGRSSIMMVGAEPTKFFTKYSVTELFGLELDRTETPFLDCDHVFFLISPIQILKVGGTGLGEMRLTLDAFSKEVEKHFD